MNKITFGNKVDTKVTSVAEINKVTGANLNEIKTVTNALVDEVFLRTNKGGYTGTSQDLKNAIDNAVYSGATTYQTEADLLAVSPTPPDGTPAIVANDTTISKNGSWSVDSGSWVKNNESFTGDFSIIDGDLILEDTEPNLKGIIYKGGQRFLHNFKSTGSQGENIFAGRESGNFTMSTGGGIDSQSCFNSGYGVLSLKSLTTGWSNVGVGYQSLFELTSGKYNTSTGVHALGRANSSDRNSAFGHYAGYENTTGFENSIFGASALRGNFTGSYNSHFGTESGYLSVNASYNSAFGYKSLYRASGGFNTAFGMNAFLNSTTAQEGVAVGFAALTNVTTGGNNVALGSNAGAGTTSGENSVFIGNSAGDRETGSQRLFIDNQSRGSDEDSARLGAMIYGQFNTVIASQKLNFNVNRLSINSGVINENAIIKSNSISFSRPSDGAYTSGIFKTLTLGSQGGLKVHGSDGVIITVGGAETTVLTIASDQSATFVSSVTATAFNTSSDYRLKEDLQNFNGLEMISNIPVYDYKWKSDKSRSFGVMAHELQEVLPQAVTSIKDGEKIQTVDYSKIVPLLIKSIQELTDKIEMLEAK